MDMSIFLYKVEIRACSDCLAKRAFGVYLMHSKSRVLGRSVLKFDHIYSHLEGHRATSCFPMRIRFQSFSLHRVIFVRYVFLASVEPKVTIDT